MAKRRNYASKKPARTLQGSRRYVCEMVEQRTLLTGSWSTFTIPTNVVPAGISNMMLLSDGTVMAHGAQNSNTWYALTPGQPGVGIQGADQSYSGGNWSQLQSMSLQRLYFPSAVLPNGNVFVIGGEFSGPQNAKNYTPTAELFDTSTHSWNSTPITPDPRGQFGDDPIEVLSDGRVLCGDIADSGTEIYDPVAHVWSTGPAKFFSDDRSDEETWVKLPDGSILTYDIYSSFNTGQFHAERYIPSDNGPGQWVNASNFDLSNPPTPLYDVFTGTNGLPTSHYELGGAVLLPNGKVFITGNNGVNGNTALYDTSTNTWSAGPTIANSYGGGDLPMAMMPNGHVLIAEWGGTNAQPTGPQLWEYDPTNNAQPFTAVANAPAFANFTYPYMLVLPSGGIMISDESNTFTLSGFQLNGISEGAAYGDDAEMSSNYPIVQLTDQFGTVSYARSSNWSNTSVGLSLVPETVNFTLPANDGLGAYIVKVIANGIASPAVLQVQCSAGSGENFTMQRDANSSFTDVTNGAGGVLARFPIANFSSVILTGDGASNTLVLNDDFLGRPGIIDGGDGNDFLRVENASVTTNVYGGSGNDDIDFGFYARDLGFIPGFTNAFGGPGTDNIFLYNNNEGIANTYNITSAQVNCGLFGGMAYSSDIEGVTVTTGTKADIVNVFSTFAGTPINLSSAGGNDTVNVGNNGSAQQINAALTIVNPPAYTSINIDDSADTIARNALLNITSLIGLTPVAISWTPADISGITISGGSGGNTFGITGAPTPQPGNSNTINGGTGNDAFNMEFASGAFVLNGQGGNDTLTVDDADFSVAETYTISSSTLSRSGLSFTFNTFEAVNLDAGDNNDIVTIAGTSPAGILNVNCNGGNDSVNFGNGTQVINFGDVNLSGGAGSNLLTMDDHLSNAGFEEDYSISPNFVTESSIFGSEGRFNYNAFAAFTISAGSEANVFTVTGTPAGASVALQGNNGNDTFNVTPIDIAGLPSILGALSLSGGSGSDGASFLGANNPSGIGYTVSGTAVAVTGGALMSYDNIEALAVNTGATTETCAVTSTSIPTTINSNATSVLNVTPVSQNVDNIAAALTLTGSSASTLNIHDELDPDSLFDSQAFGPALYNRFAEQSVSGQVVVHSTSIPISGFGSVVLDTGAVANSLGIDNNTYPLTVNAGAGTASIAIGSGHTLNGITAPITINGSGNNAISVDDSGLSVPAIVHVTPTSVGASVGDTLFGPGGSLTYHGASSLSLSTPNASTGDTIYVRPSATTAIALGAHNPTTSPGDTLTIAAAGISSPLLTPNGTGAGKYTFGNGYQPITFTGIEQSTVDAVAPAVAAPGATLHYNTLPLTLSFTFTKTLIAAPSLSAFSASSQSAVPVPFTSVSFIGNVATVSIAGILASGSYHGVIHANGVMDVPGNSMSSDYAFSFVILTADANHDGVLNGDDYFAIDNGYASHATGYVNGDFNYDGRIDADDYFIIDSNYSKGLIPLAAATAIEGTASLIATPDAINRPSLFSDTGITSAYDRLQTADDLL